MRYNKSSTKLYKYALTDYFNKKKERQEREKKRELKSKAKFGAPEKKKTLLDSGLFSQVAMSKNTRY